MSPDTYGTANLCGTISVPTTGITVTASVNCDNFLTSANYIYVITTGDKLTVCDFQVFGAGNPLGVFYDV